MQHHQSSRKTVGPSERQVWNSSWGMPEHDYWRAHILDSKLLASARSYSNSASKGHSMVSSRGAEDHYAAVGEQRVEEAESQPSSRLQQPIPPKKELIIFPRRKAGQLKRDADNVAPVQLTLQVLEDIANIPLVAAAKKLGISKTALKNACRNLGLDRWPFRRRLEHARQHGNVERESWINLQGSNDAASEEGQEEDDEMTSWTLAGRDAASRSQGSLGEQSRAKEEAKRGFHGADLTIETLAAKFEAEGSTTASTQKK
ncbi:hypothetical protein GUITHDRAFT_155915, partial [Guillardia theta CCMP2712]